MKQRAVSLCVAYGFMCLVVLSGCAKADERPDRVPATDDVIDMRAHAVERLLEGFVNPYGFVIVDVACIVIMLLGG